MSKDDEKKEREELEKRKKIIRNQVLTSEYIYKPIGGKKGSKNENT